jgi:cell fate (sporulation/competence/biofilm development) regulator YlbF (YheA/YmcA/DUF963 family)
MARLAHDDPIILDKTIALCETILARPGFVSVRSAVADFMQNEATRDRYASLNKLGSELSQKQSNGTELSPSEIEQFEAAREELSNDPLASAFFDAQQQLHRLESTLHAYITRTLQLGRVPDESDFEKEGCGPACGCHSHEA